jgi:hypothetical protein
MAYATLSNRAAAAQRRAAPTPARAAGVAPARAPAGRAPRAAPARPAPPRRTAAGAAARADVNADAFGAPGWRAAAAGAHGRRGPQPAVRQFDFLVIGSGIAGLSYALKVAPYGKVAVITKDGAAEGCTRYAQGGVCAVLDPLDSVEKHARDTMVAGAFLNDPK